LILKPSIIACSYLVKIQPKQITIAANIYHEQIQFIVFKQCLHKTRLFHAPETGGKLTWSAMEFASIKQQEVVQYFKKTHPTPATTRSPIKKISNTFL